MRHETKIDIVMAGVLVFALLAVSWFALPEDSRRGKVHDCARSMGAMTDMELVHALDTCARRYNYHITEDDLP